MPSPFPGMNPFLEQTSVWHDLHESFMPAVRELLTAQVRPHFIVKTCEHVFIHELPYKSSVLLGQGDVTVTSPREQVQSDSAAAISAPSQVRLPSVDRENLSFLEIRDRETLRVITVIELLSPANKRQGPDREQYIAKRGEVLNSAVNFVEIDLLRGGPRMPMDDLAACDYYVLVSRYQERPRAGVWPIQLRGPLPVIPVPLAAPYEDAKLDLRIVLHRVYEAAGYEDYTYQGQPEPPLSEDDAAWARQFVPSSISRQG